MKRLAILFCLGLVGLVAFLLVSKQTNTIALFEANATSSPANDTMFMVGLRIENTGPSDRLLSASSPSAQMVSIMNPIGNDAAIIIPQGGAGFLAMDGAHIMLKSEPGIFDQGAFIPLNLTFENAGTVSIRVKNTGAATMNHGLSNGIAVTPSPRLAIGWKTPPNQDGATVQLDVQNFTFVRAEDDAPHVANEGHAHVYLNGLKLGRLYQDVYDLGALSPGKYALTVALNSNDHRPYLRDGRITKDTLAFEVSE